jgi:hypothetical protein
VRDPQHISRNDRTSNKCINSNAIRMRTSARRVAWDGEIGASTRVEIERERPEPTAIMHRLKDLKASAD